MSTPRAIPEILPLAPNPVVSSNGLLALVVDATSVLHVAATFVEVESDDRLAESGDAIEYVYFPESAVLAEVQELADGRAMRVASIGREGSTGSLVLLGGTHTIADLVVQLPGRVGRVDMPTFRAAMALRGQFGRGVRLHARSLLEQTGHAVICVGSHKVEARIATWLLVNSERVGGVSMRINHESLAEILGVRRAGVSEVAQDLRELGLIHNSRGTFLVVDPEGLRMKCCCCHSDLHDLTQELDSMAIESEPVSSAASPGPASVNPGTTARRHRTMAREAAAAAAERCATAVGSSLKRVERSRSILDESQQGIQQLHAAISLYARVLKLEDAPPEEMVVLVKRVVADLDTGADDKELLRSAAVGWAIDAYYEGAAPVSASLAD
jgi:CRP-like cAMP-binding protein